MGRKKFVPKGYKKPYNKKKKPALEEEEDETDSDGKSLVSIEILGLDEASQKAAEEAARELEVTLSLLTFQSLSYICLPAHLFSVHPND